MSENGNHKNWELLQFFFGLLFYNWMNDGKWWFFIQWKKNRVSCGCKTKSFEKKLIFGKKRMIGLDEWNIRGETMIISLEPSSREIMIALHESRRFLSNNLLTRFSLKFFRHKSSLGIHVNFTIIYFLTFLLFLI